MINNNMKEPIKLRIDDWNKREDMILALASGGFPVWIEYTGDLGDKHYLVCFDLIGKNGIDWGTEDGQPGKDFDPMCKEEVIKEPTITGTKKEFMELNTDHNWIQAYKTEDGRELYGYGSGIRSWENDFEKIIKAINEK
jgi:hypothetical protein